MAHSPSADPSGTGHTAIVVIVANDMWRKKWSQTSLLLHFFNFLQMIRLLATRGHYSIDIVIGTSTLRKILMDFFAQDISVLIFLLWIVRRSFVCIFFFHTTAGWVVAIYVSSPAARVGRKFSKIRSVSEFVDYIQRKAQERPADLFLPPDTGTVTPKLA